MQKLHSKENQWGHTSATGADIANTINAGAEISNESKH